jgi:hypothetical protein
MQLDMHPSQEILTLLRQLTEHHTFYLVSGRVHEDMEKWFLKVRHAWWYCACMYHMHTAQNSCWIHALNASNPCSSKPFCTPWVYLSLPACLASLCLLLKLSSFLGGQL